MGDYLSGHEFFYRINNPYYHTLNITSEFLVFHETLKGPFDRSDTIFAPWAPEENDRKATEQFIEKLVLSKKTFFQLKKIVIKVNNNEYLLKTN